MARLSKKSVIETTKEMVKSLGTAGIQLQGAQMEYNTLVVLVEDGMAPSEAQEFLKKWGPRIEQVEAMSVFLHKAILNFTSGEIEKTQPEPKAKSAKKSAKKKTTRKRRR